MKSSLFSKLLKNKSATVIVLFAIAGILLFLFSGQGEKTLENEGAKSESFSDTEYISQLEKRVKEIVMKVNGVADADIMITLSCGPTYSYIENTNEGKGESSSDKKSETVLISKSASVKEPIIKTVEMPKVGGVAVVYRGNISPTVEAKLIGLLSSLLDLPTNKIFVTN